MTNRDSGNLTGISQGTSRNVDEPPQVGFCFFVNVLLATEKHGN